MRCAKFTLCSVELDDISFLGYRYTDSSILQKHMRAHELGCHAFSSRGPSPSLWCTQKARQKATIPERKNCREFCLSLRSSHVLSGSNVGG